MITDVSEIADLLSRRASGGDQFFRDRDDFLKQPTRAQGGEPCVECGEPIDPKANWKTRDRWLCGKPNCSRRVKTRYKKQLAAGTLMMPPDPALLAALEAEWLREPELFDTDPSAPFPFEHGRWPKPGDVISRFGHETVYVAPEANPSWAAVADYREEIGLGGHDFVLARHVQSAATVAILTDPLGRPSNMWPLYQVLHDGQQYTVPHGEPMFSFSGQSIYLDREMISDVDAYGNDYRWEAYVFTPAPTLPMWTPARSSLSNQRTRISTARGAYMARARAIGNEYDEAGYVDPAAIYARDQWMCGICGEEIDPTLGYPEPYSVSLDHIDPVSAGGAHTEENVRAAHLICNIVRGNRA